MHRALWLLMWLLPLVSGTAAAQRRLLAPTAEAPARVERSGLLTLLIESATGLTPPPGVQEERAHRAFALSLCADGIPFGAQGRCCFPLRVQNVRPMDGASLRYRVEVPVPVWVAPSRYDLTARFPGAEVLVPGGVIVEDTEQDTHGASTREGATLHVVGKPRALVRVHVGSAGLSTAGAQPRYFPLPAAQGGLQLGLVALIELPSTGVLALEPARALPRSALQIVGDHALAGRPSALSLAPDTRADSAFWWLGPDRGAEGARIEVVLNERRAASIVALHITPDGAPQLARREIRIEPRRGTTCSAHAGSAGAGWPWLALLGLLSLLVVARSWKLGPA